MVMSVNDFCMDFGSLFLLEDPAMALLWLLSRCNLIFMYNFLLLHEVYDAMYLKKCSHDLLKLKQPNITNLSPYLTMIRIFFPRLAILLLHSFLPSFFFFTKRLFYFHMIIKLVPVKLPVVSRKFHDLMFVSR